MEENTNTKIDQSKSEDQFEKLVKPPMTVQEATAFFAEIFYGEHHIPSEIKPFGYGWAINYSGDLATFDYNTLTRIVFLGHDKCYRVEIRGSSFGKVKICIWKRYSREGEFSKRHPTIETALEEWRSEGHRSV